MPTPSSRAQHADLASRSATEPSSTEEWVQRCADELVLMRPSLPHRIARELAADIWASASNLRPEIAAHVEIDSWPPTFR